MFECFHCGERAVIWQNDYTFEDYGIEGDGVVHDLRCSECGAVITYEVPIGEDGDGVRSDT